MVGGEALARLVEEDEVAVVVDVAFERVRRRIGRREEEPAGYLAGREA